MGRKYSSYQGDMVIGNGKERKGFLGQGQLWYLLCLFVAGVVLLLFFSISTSPLTSNSFCTDSAFFQMVGQSMVRGQVMYRDIFDHKGPYLFFIQYLGQRICYGRYGIFFIQVLSLLFTLYIIDHTCQLVCGENRLFFRIVSAAVFFFLFSFTLDCGNLSEEYSLPVLFLCLYLFFDFLQENRRKAFPYALLIGASFGFLAFLRLSNASLLCIIIAVLFLELFLNKKFYTLFLCIAGFLIGFFLSSLPVCLYYAHQHILSEMLYATFIFNFIYATQDAGTLRYGIILILVITALLSAWLNRRERAYFFFAVFSMAGTIGFLLLGRAYIHYYQLIIPPILGNVWLILQKYQEISLPHKRVYASIIIAIMVLFNLPLLAMHGGRAVVAIGLNTPKMETTALGRLAKAIAPLDPYGQGTYGYAALEKVSDILARIPEESYPYVYNYNTQPYLLRASGLLPYYKYCQWQESFIQLNPQIEEEIDAMFEERPPQYIILGHYEKIQNQTMLKRLHEQYDINHQNSMYILYQRKEDLSW